MAQVAWERRGATGSQSSHTAFIVGPARSGTTLLYKTLCLHPEVAFISNWRSRFAWLPAVSLLNRLARHLPSLERRVWFDGGSNAYVYGGARRIRDRLFPSPVEGEPVYTRAGVAQPGGAEPAHTDPRIALTAEFDSIRSLSNGSCFVSKRIANNLRIPLLHDIFPDARFVVLVRDGRAVAESLSRVDWWQSSHVWWYGGTPERWRAEGGDPWVMCARNWVEELKAIESGLTAVPDEQVITLRYEDVVRKPSEVFLRLAKALSLPDDAGWIQALSTLPILDRNERWRARLDASIAESITEIQRPALARYGYDT